MATWLLSIVSPVWPGIDTRPKTTIQMTRSGALSQLETARRLLCLRAGGPIAAGFISSQARGDLQPRLPWCVLLLGVALWICLAGPTHLHAQPIVITEIMADPVQER